MPQTRRGYHVLWLYCYACGAERPFWRFERWKSAQPKITRRKNGGTYKVMSANETPGLSPTARLARGSCMVCDSSAMYIITDALWEAGAYTLDFLCACGLPWDHTCGHLIDVEKLHHG